MGRDTPQYRPLPPTSVNIPTQRPSLPRISPGERLVLWSTVETSAQIFSKAPSRFMLGQAFYHLLPPKQPSRLVCKPPLNYKTPTINRNPRPQLTAPHSILPTVRPSQEYQALRINEILPAIRITAESCNKTSGGPPGYGPGGT